MSILLQKIMIALGHRGIACPIDQTLGNVYQALNVFHEQYPAVFMNAAEILLAEIEGGAVGLGDIPKRLGQIVQMLDRLHRQEDLQVWAEEDIVITA